MNFRGFQIDDNFAIQKDQVYYQVYCLIKYCLFLQVPDCTLLPLLNPKDCCWIAQRYIELGGFKQMIAYFAKLKDQVYYIITYVNHFYKAIFLLKATLNLQKLGCFRQSCSCSQMIIYCKIKIPNSYVMVQCWSPQENCIVNAYCQFSQQARTNCMQTYLHW